LTGVETVVDSTATTPSSSTNITSYYLASAHCACTSMTTTTN